MIKIIFSVFRALLWIYRCNEIAGLAAKAGVRFWWNSDECVLSCPANPKIKDHRMNQKIVVGCSLKNETRCFKELRELLDEKVRIEDPVPTAFQVENEDYVSEVAS